MNLNKKGGFALWAYFIMVISLIFLVVMIAQFVYSIPNSIYYNSTVILEFDYNLTLDTSKHALNGNATGTTSLSRTLYKLGNGSASLDASTGSITVNDSRPLQEMQNFTFAGWFNLSSAAGAGNMIFAQHGATDGSATKNWNLFYRQAGDTLEVDYVGDGFIETTGVSFLADGNWEFVALLVDIRGTTANISIMHNCTVVATTTGAISSANANSQIRQTFAVGSTVAGATNYVGGVDSVSLINRSLTSDEVCTNLYNAGAGNLNEPTVPPAAGQEVALMTVNTNDFYDGAAINNFSVRVFNSSFSYNTSTSNGTLHIDNTTLKFNKLYNLSFSSNQSGGYFNSSFFNVNVSEITYTGYLYQSVVYFRIFELITGDKIGRVGLATSSQYNTSQPTDEVCVGGCPYEAGLGTLFLRAGSYNVTLNKTGYIPINVSVSTSALTEQNVSASMYSILLSINATGVIDGIKVNNFTINVSKISSTYKTSNSTTTGLLQFGLMNGTYNISFSGQSYANSNVTLSLSTASIFPNYTFSVYTTNSINFSFFDEKTLELIGLNVSLQLISNVSSYNFSTANGFLYVDLITPSIYLARFSAAGYFERHYYFQLENQTHNQVKLYLINDSALTHVVATVLDQSNKPVEGAYIKVMRYELLLNAYTTREIYKTNVEGQAQLNLILNDEFYQFIIEYPFGTILKVSEPTYIFSTTIDFQVLIGELSGARFFNSFGIDTLMEFQNDTNSFRWTYSDPNSLLHQACLKIYRLDRTDETLVNSSCLDTASGTIVLRIANQTDKTFLAKGFVGYSPTDYFIDSLSHTFLSIPPLFEFGLHIVILLTMVVAFIGFWSVTVMMVLVPIPLLLASFAGVVAIPIYTGFVLEIVALILALIIWRRT